MGADKGKKQKSGEVKEENNGAEPIDGELVLSIEKLQEIQDELEKICASYLHVFNSRILVKMLDVLSAALCLLEPQFMEVLVDKRKVVCLFYRDGNIFVNVLNVLCKPNALMRINEEASEKVLEVEQKYNEIRKPVYNKRNDVIKSIPDFWLTAFMSHPALSELLTEEDQKIFKYLSDLEVEDFEDVKSGYSISFKFNPNPYFEDTNLTKTFTFLEEGITKITATSIKWKEGMGIANGLAEEKKGNKRSHAEERITVAQFSVLRHGPQLKQQSGVTSVRSTGAAIIWLQKCVRFNFRLFELFKSYTPPMYLASKVCPDLPNAHEFPAFNNYATLGALENSGALLLCFGTYVCFFTWFNDSEHKGDMYEIHDEVADIIKDDLWPNPLTYFNNEADEEDVEVDDDDDDEEKGSDGSEDDDDEQDDEDEDED
ncbi:NAP1-related protein 2 [Sesamum angolense]|uniref:NAP1-related protein 2 n=1 Tax=Sesamum angolense TaxID=2727404 RepID=A0AAE2BR30_9LAMI|nr:NAP1-related protein 2 [Sesamum angolense]